MFGRLFRYIGHCIHNAPPSITNGLILLFLVGTVLLLLIFGKKKGLKWSAVLMLIEYMVLLLLLAVLLRRVQDYRRYDLTPFWSYRAYREGVKFLLTQNIANVIAFMPIGLLLGCVLGRMKWRKVLLIGVTFSVLIETLQFVLSRGFAEFDDVFHNVLGCVVGYGIYLGIAWLVKRVRERRVVEMR